jgi:signal transduction histidine kinase
LQKISDAVERLSQVIQDILNVSLIDAERLDLAHEPVFLNSTIQSVLHNLRSFGPQRELVFDLGEGLKDLPVIEGDPRRLHQAIWNVISNAIKYTPDHGTITIDGETVEDTVHIWVTDTGIGIPEEELEHIFERFYVLEDVAFHRSSKTAFKGGGMGLGLAVTKGIIEGHNGRIWAESKGQDEDELPGSTVHLLLPIGKTFVGKKGNG